MSKCEGDYDVVSWVVMWKGEYVSKGLLTPLSQFFTNGALVDPKYDIDDIADAYLQNGGVVGGKKGYMPGKPGALYGVPFGAETSILAYRKDMLEAQGIALPNTYDELRSAMRKLKAAGIPSFGFGDASAAFLGGDAAMYIDTLEIAAMARDPKLSKVDGKVRYALHPTGTRCGSESGGFAVGIPAN